LLFPQSPEVSLQPADHVKSEKTALRIRMRELRAALISAQGQRLAASVAAHGLGFLDSANLSVVSAFSSMPDELDTQQIMLRLAAGGYRIALPVMQGKGKPLVFRAWSPGDAMNEGIWGIREPKADKALLAPDVFLVPLLAFDRKGWRLGYGGGFYDRTLQEARRTRPVVAVGFALDEQEVDAVPHLDYDERLDWVLTPSGPRRC
jgi:5-formyltetrahydrofolate cyclo-ligase